MLIADTSVTEMPTADQLADIAIQGAAVARRFGLTPRVALLASSTFGFPRSERSDRIVEAVQILDGRQVDFEYDGEMAVDVALDKDKLALYPFARITDTANVLIMPAIHSASISTKLLQQMGQASVMGPMLVGLEKSVQIAPLGAKMSEIYNAAVVAAYDINSLNAMDFARTTAFMARIWDEEIIPALTDYIRIPNKSPAFDADWEKHGHMEKAVTMFADWARAKLQAVARFLAGGGAPSRPHAADLH